MMLQNTMPKAAPRARAVRARSRSLNTLLQNGLAISVAGHAARELLAGTPFSFAKTHWMLPLAADEHA
jgi:hypothetical protein